MPRARDEFLYEHFHSPSKVYPTIGAGGAGWVVGATITPNAVAGTFGVAATIIPAATVLSKFDIHWINIEQLTDNAEYELVLENAAGTVEFGRVRFTRVNNNEAANGVPFVMKVVPGGTQVNARVAKSTAGANSVRISVFYHEY